MLEQDRSFKAVNHLQHMVFGFQGASLLKKAVSTWAFRLAFPSEYSEFLVFGLRSILDSMNLAEY